MKKPILYSLAAAGVLSMFGFLAWTFSLYGTVGLFYSEPAFRFASIGLGALGVILLGLALLHIWLSGSRSLRALSLSLLILAALEIVVPAVGFVYLGGLPPSNIGDTSPQLMVTDVAGSHGIPNIAIVRYSEKPSADSLSWGKAGSGLTDVIDEEYASQQHTFMLRDLEPDTHYSYQINDTEPRSFATPGISGQDLHFAIFSDTHYGAGASRNDLTAAMLMQIAEPANGFSYLFSLGDLVQYGFRDSDWKLAMQGLTPTTSIVPTGFATGNHDTMFGGVARYRKYCYPDGIDSQSGSQYWHRVDVGTVHFLMLDLAWSAERYTAPQTSWLEAQLESIPTSDWTIVLSHRFFYSSGSADVEQQLYGNPETIDAFTPLFEEYGVDIVFSGHNHQLEVLQESGVTYVVCGAFGGKPDAPTSFLSPASQWYAAGPYAFADVTIKGTVADISFRDPSGEVLASLIIQMNR
ncbi:metallophosphoesterase [Chloroflexota bacterium]